MVKNIYIIAFTILLCYSQISHGQTNDSINQIIVKNIDKLKNNNFPSLFLHLDKTIYTNNEIIWFAGYMLNANEKETLNSNIISVSLISENTRHVVLGENYIMDSGLALGSILLPDSIIPGNYHLVAYTNMVQRNGMPMYLYIQQITVKTSLMPKFSAQISLLKNVSMNEKVSNVSIKVSGLQSKKNGKLPPVEIIYSISGKPGSKVYTDERGEVVISLPHDEEKNRAKKRLDAILKFNGETKNLSVEIPFASKQVLNMKFFPEGGNLSERLNSTIGWETRDDSGRPVSTTAILYQNMTAIDTIETDITGMGSFKLTPTKSNTYSVKLANSNIYDNDISYNLPPISTGIPVITLANSIATDTLTISLKSTEPEEYILVVQDRNQIYANQRVSTSLSGRKIKISLSDLPRGISSVLIYDQRGRPLIERLFFAHYKDDDDLTIKLDKKIYRAREKVTIKLRMNEKIRIQKEQAGIVSIAAVQANRLELSKTRNIDDYFYLENKLGQLPISPIGRQLIDMDYLTKVLLVKGWSRFKIEGMNTIAADDTLGSHSLVFRGKVTRFDKDLKQMVSMTLLRDTVFNVLSTDTNGTFILTPELMVVSPEKKLSLFINQKNNKDFRIAIANPFDSLNRRLAGQVDLSVMPLGRMDQSTVAQVYKGNDKSISLDEVVIKSRKDEVFFGKSRVNECGDYVCIAGYLNCPLINHMVDPMNTWPVVGKSYKTWNNNNGNVIISSLIYKGCKDRPAGNYSLPGIFISREFYADDYKNKASDEIDYLSTAYWQPLVQLNGKKESEISFYTSDLKGLFRIIIQGVSSSGTLYSSVNYTVE